MDISVNPTLLTDWRIGYYRYNVIDHKYDQYDRVCESTRYSGHQHCKRLAHKRRAGVQYRGRGPAGNPEPNNPTGGGAQYGSALNITRCNCPLIEREDQFQLVNNWTKLFGNHAYKFGVDLRYGRNLRVPSD